MVARAGLSAATTAKSLEDFAASDLSKVLKVLSAHAKPLSLPNRATLGALELTKQLCAL